MKKCADTWQRLQHWNGNLRIKMQDRVGSGQMSAAPIPEKRLPPFFANTNTYLIFVTTATTGGGVLFLSRRTFSHRDAKGIALSKGFPEEEKIQILKIP